MNHESKGVGQTVLVCVVISALLMAVRVGSAQSLQSVAVKVSLFGKGDGSMYAYRVVNRSEKPIIGLQIGYNYYTREQELSVPPSGWSDREGLPSDVVSSPAGWNVVVVTQEESDFTKLRWQTLDSGRAVLAGRALAGFSVKVPIQSSGYSSGHWTAVFADGSVLSGLLTLDGDVNEDGIVDCRDLAIVRAAFGKKTGQPGFDLRADIDLNGLVEIRDLSYVSQRLPAGTRCP